MSTPFSLHLVRTENFFYFTLQNNHRRWDIPSYDLCLKCVRFDSADNFKFKKVKEVNRILFIYPWASNPRVGIRDQETSGPRTTTGIVEQTKTVEPTGSPGKNTKKEVAARGSGMT